MSDAPTTEDLGAGAELLSLISRLNRWATSETVLPIPTAQARLLVQIADSGPSRISDLARLDQCSQPTMTSQVQRLESAGLVHRSADPTDARASLISASAAGRALIADVRASRARTVRPLLGRLDPGDSARVTDVVEVLRSLVALAAAPTSVEHHRPDEHHRQGVS